MKYLHTFFRFIMTSVLPSVFLVVLGLVLYGLSVRGIYGKPIISEVKDNLDQATKPFELSPERGRYAIIVSLAEDGTFALRRELGMMVYPDVGYIDGKFYSYFAPGISILALPFYLWGLQYNIPQVAAYFVISVIAALNLAVIFTVGRKILKLPVWASMFAALVFGFASVGWSYANTLYQHQVTAFLLLLGFYSAWKVHHDSKLSLFWSAIVWSCFGFGVFIDYPNVLLLAPMMVYFGFATVQIQQAGVHLAKVKIRPVVILTSIVLVGWVVLHGYYNYANFGNWTRVSGSLVGYKAIVESNLENTPNAEKYIEAKQGEKDPVKFFTEDKTPAGFTTLFLSDDRSLFLYSPIFIIGLFGLYLMIKKGSPEHATLIATIGVLVFLYSSWGDPWGGWAFGPRYLIPALPILALAVSYWLVHGRLILLSKMVTFVFSIYSIAIAMLGAFTTNAVPPKVEAVPLGMQYNFMQNLMYYLDGKSSSFVFNYYLSPFVTLGQFMATIWIVLCILFAVVLFVLPVFTKRYDH